MNIKKICYALLTFVSIIFLVSFSFYLYIKTQREAVSQETSSIIAGNADDSLFENSTIQKMLDIANDGTFVLYDYSVSPDKKYVLTTTEGKKRGDIFYSLINLESKTELFDGYTMHGDGELNLTNHSWTNDNKLVLVSNFGAEGGEGFPGILVVNLIDQTFYRLVDMTDMCPDASLSNCTNAYTFDIKTVTNKSLTYGVGFDSNSIGQDPSFSYYKEKTVSLK